jgi:hypothetical protein
MTVQFSGLPYTAALNLITNNPPGGLYCGSAGSTSTTTTIMANNCAHPASPVALTVDAKTGNGTALTGYYVLFNCVGIQTTATGFTPATFAVIPGATHTVAVLDYGCYAFDHWSDTNSSSRYRAFSITSATTFTAVYKNTCTPTPATSSTISVNAIDTSGKAVTGMYTTLWQNGALLQSCFGPCTLTVSNGQSYQVMVSDFGSSVFSHWSDGTATRSYGVNVGSTSTTVGLTAVYT